MLETHPRIDVFSPDERQIMEAFLKRVENERAFSSELFEDCVFSDNPKPTREEYTSRITVALKMLLLERSHSSKADVVSLYVDEARRRIAWQIDSLVRNRYFTDENTSWPYLTWGEAAEVLIVNFFHIRERMEDALWRKRQEEITKCLGISSPVLR